MSLYRRQNSRVGGQNSGMGNISRVYNYVNANNGGLGVNHFLTGIMGPTKPIKPINQIRPIIKEVFDLSIYIILETNTQFDLQNILGNIDPTHKIKTKTYSNNSDLNIIKNDINNDVNSRLIIVDKNVNLDMVKTLLIPYIIYDDSNNNINNYVSNAIHSMLFYKIQQKIQ